MLLDAFSQSDVYRCSSRGTDLVGDFVMQTPPVDGGDLRGLQGAGVEGDKGLELLVLVSIHSQMVC